jgi:hypothetical protein
VEIAVNTDEAPREMSPTFPPRISALTEQHAVRAKQSTKKRQTKPIEISHKPLTVKELMSDGFGLLYAKRTQFPVVEAATLEARRCRKPARRQAWPTQDQVALLRE